MSDMKNEKELLSTERMILTGFFLPAEHKRKLEKVAKERYMSTSALMREIVREWISRKEKQ